MPQCTDWAWEGPRKKTRGNDPIYTNLGIKIKQLKLLFAFERNLSFGASLLAPIYKGVKKTRE